MTSQTRTETLCAENRPSPAITRAAERYLEQYGDPLVMNTYLKMVILVLAAICLMLGFLIFRSQKALANIHPLVIRIDDVGHAEAVDFRDFNYRPKEAENKYYLSRWAQLFFSRKADLPAKFTHAVQGLLDDFGKALGVNFVGPEGEEFFRSSLIQTAFYGLFAGWALWWQGDRSKSFAWEDLAEYLAVEREITRRERIFARFPIKSSVIPSAK